MNSSLKQLVSLASKIRMSEQQQEEQRRSFAYGTANIENEAVTRQMVDDAAEKIRAEGRANGEPVQRGG